MTPSDLVLILVLGFAGAYILNALQLERRISHEGPFKSKTKVVIFPQIQRLEDDGATYVESEHRQAVAFWDYVRRLDGVYTIAGDEWTVNQTRSERWTCSFCLSFWTTVPFSLTFSLFTGLWIWFPIAHLSIAVISRIAQKIAYE